MAHRILLIASIENDNFLNKDNIFIPNYTSGRYIAEPTDEPVKQSFAFEYSTGTSNRGENFPNIFLPIMNINAHKNYIEKAANLDLIVKDELIEVILPQIIDKCKDNAMIHLEYFLKRFGCWKQLQISAALGGETWETFEHFKILREFALTHDFISERTHFIERQHAIHPIDWNEENVHIEGIAQLSSLQKTISEYKNNDSKQIDNLAINKWLHINNVLSVEELDKLESIPLPLADAVEEKSYNKYQQTLLFVSDIDDVTKKIEFPDELQKAYEENRDIIQKINIPFAKIKRLFIDIQEANKIRETLYESYKADLDALLASENLENLKYIPFLKYRKNEKSYFIPPHKETPNLIEALEIARKTYPYYDENKFNWKVCSL